MFKKKKKRNLYVVRLYVKDNETGYIHEVGSNIHDRLIIIDGALHYYNYQNGCGTYGNKLYSGTYSFCDKDGNIALDFGEYNSVYKFLYTK